MDSGFSLGLNEYDKQVSSTNFHKFELLVISLMYKRNKSGPNILPCGTPQVNIPISEFVLPILKVNFHLLVFWYGTGMGQEWERKSYHVSMCI